MEHAHRSVFVDLLGSDAVRDDSETCVHYGKDWAKGFAGTAGGVLFPSTIEHVRDVVAYCHAQRLHLVPSGGRTGLSGGASAMHGEIVLSIERLNRLVEVDPAGASLTCEAGMVTARVQEAAAEHDLFYPIHLASAGSCQIGGNISTNAGGIHVIRYGHTRSQVLGLKVVTGVGELIDFSPLRKNRPGYHLMGNFIGSEGTLGIVVEATLALQPRPRHRRRILFACSTLRACLQVLNAARRGEYPILAFEFFERSALKYVVRHRGFSDPFQNEHALYGVLEIENAEDVESVHGWLAGQLDAGHIADAVVSDSARSFDALMAYRESIGEALSTLARPIKNDLAVPTSRVAEFYDEVRRLRERRFSDFELVMFGHAGDGNIHVNVIGPPADGKDFLDAFAKINDALYTLVGNMGGSIAAEHGVGLLKRDFLSRCRSSREIALMQDIKALFDPHGILNPGKVLPAA